MSMNIDGLSSQQLSELISLANQRKKVLAKRKPANQVKAAVAKFLKSTGWTFDELYGKATATKPATAQASASTSTTTPARKSTKGRKLARWHRSTAIRPTRKKPGPDAASRRAGWPRKSPRARSSRIS